MGRWRRGRRGLERGPEGLSNHADPTLWPPGAGLRSLAA